MFTTHPAGRRAARPGAWPRAAVFDCDGLLLASTACWEAAYAQIAGCDLDDVDVAALAGASVAAAAVRLGGLLERHVSALEVRRALCAAVAAHPPAALPGASELTRALAARMPVAVATNGPRELVAHMLRHAGVADRLDAIVSAEETAADKPGPDVYLEACRRLAVDPSDAVAFEDSPRGARAARAAGLVLVGVPSRPGARLDADLTVARLDDPRLTRFLGLERGRVATNGRPA